MPIIEEEEKKVDQVKPEEGGTPTEKVVEQLGPDGKTVIPEEKMVEIEGKKMPLSQIQDALKDSENKSKWQKELTQRGQSITDDTKLIERLKPMADFLDDPANTEESKRIQGIAKGIKEAKEELLEEGDFEDPAVAKLRERYDTALAKIDKTLTAMQRGSSDKEMADTLREIAQEEKEVKGKYKDLSETEIDFIGKIATASGGENLVKVADEYVKYLRGRDKNTIKAYLEGKEKDGEKFTETGGLPSASPERKLKLFGEGKDSPRYALEQSLKQANKEE